MVHSLIIYKKYMPKETTNKIWFDPKTNTLGFGKAYGVSSFNNLPVGAQFGSEAIEASLNNQQKTKLLENKTELSTK